MIKRHHPDYHLDMIISRAGVYALNMLLPSPTKGEKLKQRLTTKLQKVLGKNDHKITGKAMFIKELCENIKERSVRTGRKAGKGVYSTCLTRANERWPFLSEVAKERYRTKALEYQNEVALARTDKAKQILDSLELATEKVEEQRLESCRQPLELSSCRLSGDAIGKWQALYDAMPKEMPKLKELRENAMTAPVPPDREEVERLQALPWERTPDQVQKPAWLAPVCHLRQEQYPFAVRLTEASGTRTV
eukprot:5979005-Lingulodinium_polyedra.AAC.1